VSTRILEAGICCPSFTPVIYHARASDIKRLQTSHQPKLSTFNYEMIGDCTSKWKCEPFWIFGLFGVRNVASLRSQGKSSSLQFGRLLQKLHAQTRPSPPAAKASTARKPSSLDSRRPVSTKANRHVRQEAKSGFRYASAYSATKESCCRHTVFL
jgi:hypothetical protein